MIDDYTEQHNLNLEKFTCLDPIELLTGEKITNRTALIYNRAWLAAQIIAHKVANGDIKILKRTDNIFFRD